VLNNATDWLSIELGYQVHIPLPDETMSVMRERVLAHDKVCVFGAGQGGIRIHSVLKRYNVEVVYFIDNQPSGDVCGIPVYCPKSVPSRLYPVVIASVWFVDIAHQLKISGWSTDDAIFYILPDILQIESTLYDTIGGWPFLQIMSDRLDDFMHVANLWEDKPSRIRFLELLAYRLAFFMPGSISPDSLPCTSVKYLNAEQQIHRTKYPPGLTDDIKNLIEYQFAHPSYLEPEFMQPRCGDIVIDGGGWQGDTAFWYLQKIGKSGKIYVFEPSKSIRNQLYHNVSIFDYNQQIVIVPCGLSNYVGESGWCDLKDSSPCSHIVEGDDISITTIDKYVDQSGIEKLDVIKLDVEGEDHRALLGAKNIIRKSKPDLAISMYHSPHHLVDIPLWIEDLHLGYCQMLIHNQVGITETICLATTRKWCR